MNTNIKQGNVTKCCNSSGKLQFTYAINDYETNYITLA